MRLRVVWAALGTFALIPCLEGCDRAGGSKGTAEASESSSLAERGENAEEAELQADHVLRLSREQLASAGVSVVVAVSGPIDSGLELLGEVRPNGDRVAEIAPRFAGIVRDVRKKVGDVVRSGDTLAVIESSESLSPFEMKTLIEGVVLEKRITRGESVDRGAPCFTVADLSSVWVDLSVYQKNLNDVRVGNPVRISVGEDGVQAEGTISYVTPSVDSQTRTATARVILPNPSGSWLPGMFVTARIQNAAIAGVTVPSSAVQTIGGQPSVFVETRDGFLPRSIEVGREGDDVVEVRFGLAAGERVAAENAFLLKAELGKSEAEDED